ncbi:glutathione S-transferase family protein [Mesobaculum littorinae]|uniref:Glutathione S-transferase family protein n=1 Tax=Mesobaculum littorinae TaxID=2486419 RepID=A0A438AL13_9RHOB|nr:glutathione S-transferase family protein [Mesobaculum littorinae]RVV99418.1 glutathione S-transferase family protein [Mesobaculum littorinae]
MGYLENGTWHDGWYDTKSHDGKFVRENAGFRDWISNEDGARFPPEPGRYHLFVSYACPWACRTIIARRLKGLEGVVGMTIVNPYNRENGWEFGGFDDAGADPLFDSRYLYEFYQLADPQFSGRVTTPTLWDNSEGTIVSNESADILRMFNSSFGSLAERADLDLCPEDLRGQIDDWNERIYPALNNGVYRAGFATSQDAYEAAFTDVFAMLDTLEAHFSSSRYLAGDRLTEADWRLFVTLVRFDTVYFSHFKCNRQRISDYEALHGYLRDLYQVPGIAETVRFDHIKAHYYGGMLAVNPTGIIPRGPTLSLSEPHGRGGLD